MPSRKYFALILLILQMPLSAQTWDVLRGLKAGDRIQIVDAEGNRHRGTFSTVSDDSIALETRQGRLSVDKARIRKVQIRSSSARLRNILIGAGIGVAVGVTVDQTAGTYLRNEVGEGPGGRALTYIAPIALIAGLCSFPAYKTLYRSR